MGEESGLLRVEMLVSLGYPEKENLHQYTVRVLASGYNGMDMSMARAKKRTAENEKHRKQCLVAECALKSKKKSFLNSLL